jgi:hypothetical protein
MMVVVVVVMVVVIAAAALVGRLYLQRLAWERCRCAVGRVEIRITHLKNQMIRLG